MFGSIRFYSYLCSTKETNQISNIKQHLNTLDYELYYRTYE